MRFTALYTLLLLVSHHSRLSLYPGKKKADSLCAVEHNLVAMERSEFASNYWKILSKALVSTVSRASQAVAMSLLGQTVASRWQQGEKKLEIEVTLAINSAFVVRQRVQGCHQAAHSICGRWMKCEFDYRKVLLLGLLLRRNKRRKVCNWSQSMRKWERNKRERNEWERRKRVEEREVKSGKEMEKVR